MELWLVALLLSLIINMSSGIKPFPLTKKSLAANPALHKWATNHGFMAGSSIFQQGKDFYHIVNGRLIKINLPKEVAKAPTDEDDIEHTRSKARQGDIDEGFKKGGKGVGKLAKKLMHASEFKKTAMKMAQAALADSMVDGSMVEEALNATRELIEKYYKKALKAIDEEIKNHHKSTMPTGIEEIMTHAQNPGPELTILLTKMMNKNEAMIEEITTNITSHRTYAMVDALDGFNSREEPILKKKKWNEGAIDNILDAIGEDRKKKKL